MLLMIYSYVMRFSATIVWVAMVFSFACGEARSAHGRKPPCKTNCLVANRAPTAIIRSSGSVLPLNTEVTLDGSESSDPDGQNLAFLWESDPSNPPNNLLDGVLLTEPTITFTATALGTFKINLTVSDGITGASTSVTFTVSQDVSTSNNAPPAVTGFVVNDTRFIPLSETNRPVLFVSHSGTNSMLRIRAVGSDADGDILTALSDGALGNDGTYTLSTEARSRDSDWFASATGSVWLRDVKGAESPHYTIDLRVIPKANPDATPNAVFVDCNALTPGTGSMANPHWTLQTGIDEAVNRGGGDVFVAIGTCTENVAVRFDNLHIFGLFLPNEAWRRRTEPSDKQLDGLTNGTTRFYARTILRTAAAESLAYTPISDTDGGELWIDGISFELSGNNLYGLNVSLPSVSPYNFVVTGSEFIGNTVTASGATVGAGIQLFTGEANPSTSGRVLLMRNFFSVGAADNGSRYQVRVIPNAGKGARVKFLSNVFYGSVGHTNGASDACGTSGNPAAFCFYRTSSQDLSTAYADWTQVWRNLFWAKNETGTLTPVVLDVYQGRIMAQGNVFYSEGTTQTVRFVRAQNSGFLGYNAFPTNPQAKAIYINTSNTFASTSDFDCLADNGFNKKPTCTTSATTNFYSTGSTEYTSATTATTQPWRIANGAAFYDRFSEAPAGGNMNTYAPEAKWDFDGRFGSADDPEATVGTNFYNAGPFEPRAPLY